MRKKGLCLLLCLLLAVSLFVGCGGQQSGGNEDKVLYHAFVSTPYTTLDPSLEGSNGIMVLQNVYETLTHYNDETAEIEPMLAESWTFSEDGLQWVFKLREDITFHDGSKMTAETVKKSIERTRKLGGSNAYIWDCVKDMQATGDYEITFSLNYAAPLDLITSAGYTAYIMSDAACDENSEWFNAGNDGGSGPYTVAQASKDTVILKAFEDYRGGWQDNQYKNVIIREVAESSARRQLIETGEAQIASDFSTTDLESLKKNTDKVEIYQASTFKNVLIFNNTEAEFMNNPDFRRALSYAFPYQETIDSVLEGAGVQGRGMIPSGLWGYDETLPQYTTDMDKAKEYLAKSGVDVSKVNLVLTYTTGFDMYATWGQMYQASLKQLGISLEVRAMEWDAQTDMAKSTNPNDRQDMFVMMWWPEYADPSSWFNALVRSEPEINYSLAYLNDPAVDAKIDEAVGSIFSDREHSIQVFSEVQKKLIDDADFIFPYELSTIYAVNKAVTGVHENPGYPIVVDYYKVTDR